MSRPIDHALEVIRIEAEAIAALESRLDNNFNEAVESILACRGRVIVSGMGKSGLIGKKITATFNSTGIASFFLHPAEAMHGDLGLIRSEDLLMLISKSGQLDEADLLMAAAKRNGVKIIALCGTVGSELYQRADICLNCSVDTEACPNNLVPTSSSTAALVMGDALAVALLHARNFTPEDFAALHPGGSLGRRLLMRVSERHHTGDELPLVDESQTMGETMLKMTSMRLGCVLTRDSDKKLTGIFTDGDLRRLVETRQDFMKLTAGDVVIRSPKAIEESAMLDAALAMMEKYSITQLPTLNDKGELVGLLHFHDILKSKLV